MSAEAKPVEAPVVPTEPVVEAPVTTETAPVVETVEPTTESAAVDAAPATEEAAVKEEVKPVEEGILGYKGPGFVKGLFFQKKFFWFGTEPVESKALTSYLRGEKNQEAASKNVAWAAHTGKGLLFFSKKATEKATPAGLYNLSEVSDIAEEGTLAFVFTAGGHKHTFEASTLAERDNWVAVLKTQVAEATELAPTVVETEEYKKAHSDLVKPAVVAAALPKKSVEAPKEEKTEAAKEEKKEEKAEAKEEKKEEKKSRKSRSASRKRASIFGTGFGSFGGKKDEKVEAPKEETPAVATEEPAEPVVEPAAATVPETTEVATEAATEASPAPPAEKPTITKRNSIFGSLKSPFHKEKKTETEAPVVPAKDAEPVSENAPVIPAVEASEPLATSVASPATVPAETTEAPVTNGETKAAETPVVKTDKRKSSLPWLTKKDKTATSDEETEKPKSPFAKLRATVKGKSSPKAEKAAEKPVESTETPAAEPATETPAVTEPVVSEPAKVVPATTPQVTASA
jgi:hypothetical protein